ncbi:MAG: thermonuclease family protein, partial [Spirochaetales bacterium]|nr:thermonuclease family protein [Spirochaetales bacterium]
IYKKEKLQDITETDVVEVRRKNNKYTFITRDDVNAGMLYTYSGSVVETVDGDTLWVNLDLGFETRTKQKVRLRGINAEDITTEEGKKAKEYTEERLKQCDYVIVKTYWRDKYNRYLADIYYDEDEKDIYKIAEWGKFLNSELLKKGLVRKY